MPFPTAVEAWECAATHGIECNNKQCLWDGCGMTFKTAQDYKRHEPVRAASPPQPAARLASLTPLAPPSRASQKHTGNWPYKCTTCLKGHSQQGAPSPCSSAQTRADSPPTRTPSQSGRRSAARSRRRASAAGARRGKAARRTSRRTRRSAARARRRWCPSPEPARRRRARAVNRRARATATDRHPLHAAATLRRRCAPREAHTPRALRLGQRRCRSTGPRETL